MALTIVNPTVTKGIADAFAPVEGDPGYRPIDWTGAVTDPADKTPTFDTDHAVPTNLLEATGSWGLLAYSTAAGAFFSSDVG